jgi:hypothetical protein
VVELNWGHEEDQACNIEVAGLWSTGIRCARRARWRSAATCNDRPTAAASPRSWWPRASQGGSGRRRREGVMDLEAEPEVSRHVDTRGASASRAPRWPWVPDKQDWQRSPPRCRHICSLVEQTDMAEHPAHPSPGSQRAWRGPSRPGRARRTTFGGTFEQFCMHAGGRSALEPSKCTLHRFSNPISSSPTRARYRSRSERGDEESECCFPMPRKRRKAGREGKLVAIAPPPYASASMAVSSWPGGEGTMGSAPPRTPASCTTHVRSDLQKKEYREFICKVNHDTCMR